MRILGLVAAGLILLFGLRLTLMAMQTALRSAVMVRRGIRTEWQPVERGEALKRAFRDGLMGILLLVLGVVMMI
jgi:hypothetical protein